MAKCAQCGGSGAGSDGLCGGCRLRAFTTAKRVYHFTTEMNEGLRAAYFGDRTRLTEAITVLERKYPEVPRKQWLAQAKRIGVATTGRFRRWTDEEDAYLSERIGQVSMTAIARKLGRSREAVEGHAERLGLSRRRSDDSYCVSDLVKGFGVHFSVGKRWIERGLLGEVRRCQGLRVSGEDVVQFIRKYPDLYDLRKVDQVWFKSMIFGRSSEEA